MSSHRFSISHKIHSNFHFRIAYQIVKSLDEQKSSFTSIPLLFNEDIEKKRNQLLKVIDSILLEDFESFGKKIRDILWRKVYYDPISIAKRILKHQKTLNDHDLKQLSSFIKSAIKNYKTLILKFEELFSLDLRNVIDFSIIDNEIEPIEKRSEKIQYTTFETSHANETIHMFLICLGDLHRYCIEFNFTDNDITLCKSKELAAKYYIEAFKFNPKIGMPHNQLGTLKAGENHEIDSIFHYIYSLCSQIPFELSETNVNRIFQQNVEALERNDTVCDGFNVRDFIMQMILVIDIFFYDKEIDDLNTICKTVLISFKEYLSMNRRGYGADKITFQLTSIFMLCLLKLKQNNSPKVHSLNAFLVAFCAEIVEVSSYKVETFIVEHQEENEKFFAMYEKNFIKFEKQIKSVKGNRQNQNNSCSEPNENGTVSGGSSQRDEKICGTSGGTSTGSSQKNGNLLSVDSGKERIKIAKKPKNDRRRRRRITRRSESDYSGDDSDDNSDDDSVSGESMNSDFESDFDEDDERFSTTDDDEDNESDQDDEDIVIENEKIVFNNGNENSKKKENSLSLHGSSVDDFVIEEEKIVYANSEASQDEVKIHENHPLLKRMKYKKKYAKDDPNLILKFHATNVEWMKSLKLLFDWLRVENKLLINCYESNPEFINMIMKLVNYLNIDIFTRKIFFDD
jgi:protein SMG5